MRYHTKHEVKIMVDEKLFDPILDNDERIIETFKPNQLRFVWLPFIFLALLLGVLLVPPILILVTEENEALWPIIGMSAFFGLLVLLIPLINFVRYKKTVYCYTNKRLLLRTGFIGADYQAIDFDMIGAMNVRVDFLDKLVKPNTGTITFASPASPMIQTGQPGGGSAYAFKHIVNPYEVYKRVKQFSSQNKDGNFNS